MTNFSDICKNQMQLTYLQLQTEKYSSPLEAELAHHGRQHVSEAVYWRQHETKTVFKSPNCAENVGPIS
jgi:hypothetical protein